MLQSINPATGEFLQSYSEHSAGQINQVLQDSKQAYKKFKIASFAFKKRLLIETANILRKFKGDYSHLMTLEMGKPVAQAEAEIDKCAWVCEYYAENGERFLKDEPVETDASKSYITFQPIGTVLAIMPWNFPFWQVFRFAVPTLMAGNTAILKHSSNVTGCSIAIESIFREAGFPEGVFQSLVVPGNRVPEIIADPVVKAVSLTGSTPAGRAVGEAAGKSLKKCVLELGGSDPYIILEDADLPKAIESCVTGRLINGGQSCIAAKRFIVIDKIYDKFVEMFTSVMSSKKMGDPFNRGNDLGPQARTDLRDELHGQVLRSIQKGARLTFGGKVPNERGAYYPPTVLADVEPGMAAFDEELFGPAAAIIKAANEDEAVKLANQSSFGLGAAVFTSDIERGERIAKFKLETGSCFLNAFVKSDPRLPFGGINESGFGRELSYFGIREFVNVKTVFIK